LKENSGLRADRAAVGGRLSVAEITDTALDRSALRHEAISDVMAVTAKALVHGG
jgi:hypothetical protein